MELFHPHAGLHSKDVEGNLRCKHFANLPIAIHFQLASIFNKNMFQSGLWYDVFGTLVDELERRRWGWQAQETVSSMAWEPLKKHWKCSMTFCTILHQVGVILSL